MIAVTQMDTEKQQIANDVQAALSHYDVVGYVTGADCTAIILSFRTPAQRAAAVITLQDAGYKTRILLMGRLRVWPDRY